MSRILGLALIALGLVGLAWGGFNYTTKEKVIDLGPLHATRDQNHNVSVPPIAGTILLVAGAAIMLSAGRKAA